MNTQARPLPAVRPGCGECSNCRYLKYLRPDIMTALIAPAFRERTLASWDRIQLAHPCTDQGHGGMVEFQEQRCDKCAGRG